MNLEGKVSVVTGGGSGIGRAISIKLASLGSAVAVLDISEKGGKETVDYIKSLGKKAEFIKLDVSDESSVKQVVNSVVEKFGGIDVLINNAGIEPPPASILETSTEWFDKVMNVNLKGIWFMIKYVAPHMISRGGGSIVNIASVAGIKPLAGAFPYSVSKAGVIMLTKLSALELGKYKIRVNAVAPGWVRTPMVERAAKASNLTLEQFEKVNSQRIPLGRFAEPNEIANLVAFLASEDSSYMNGSVVVIDGGIVLS
ncbi:MAG: SDR family NAD(P)-dependent oxidoreductase [Fervidicoccaceae archaeon]